MRDDWSTHLRPADAESPSAPRETDRRLLYVIIFVCGGVGALFLACLGAMYVAWMRPADVRVVPAQSAEEKRDELRRAFSATDRGVSALELSALETLFDQVVAASSEEDDIQFQGLFDRDRLFRAMQSSGKMPREFRFLEELTRQTVLGSVWIPWYVSRYDIVHVRWLPEPDEAVVYGFFWTEDGDVAEMRWWVKRRGVEWKIYDWELLQFGLRCSHELALYQRDDVEPYTQLFEELGEANTAFNEHSEDVARRRMQRAEELLPKVPEPLREEARLWTAYYWSYSGHFDEALRVVEAVAAPDEHPGVDYIRMLYHDDRREDEELLACADRYEASLGPGPNSAQFRSAALFRLGRLSQAAEASRQVLRHDPDNAEHLERFALAADDKQLAELPTLLTASREPTDSAVSLATSLDYHGDTRGLDAVAKAISPREGKRFGLPMDGRTTPANDAEWLANGAKVAWVWGLHHESRGDDVTASELYLRAARSEVDPDERNQFLYRYLDVMQRLGRTVEAYRAVPAEAAADAFAYLANGYEEEVSPLPPDLLEALLAEHEPRGQDDPWWWLHRGNVAAAGGDADEAVRSYREGLTRATADDGEDEHEAVWALDSQLLTVLVRSGRWREAWEQQQQRNSETAFETLANHLRWTERWDELGQLVALRRESHPDNPWCDYFDAVVAVEREDFTAADELLVRGESRLATDEAEHRRDQFRTLRIEARIASGDVESAWAPPELRESAVGSLAQHYLSQGDAESVLRLAERARGESPPIGRGWMWGCRALWELRDYPGLVALAESMPADVRGALFPYEASELRGLLFRSQLRAGEPDRALETARKAHQEDDETRWLLVAHALRGDSDKFQQMLRGAENYRYNSVYADEDAGPLLCDAEHRSWREASPPWLPVVRDSGWVALLADARPLEDDEVRRLAAGVFGPEARVDALAAGGPSAAAWRIRASGAVYGVAAGTGLYTDPAEHEEWPGLDEGLRESLHGHRAWVYAGLLRGIGGADATDEELRPARGLLAAALREPPLAVHNTEHHRLVAAGEELTRLMDDGTPCREWQDAGVMVWLGGAPAGSAQERETALVERIQRRLRATGLDLWRQVPVECRVWLDLSGTRLSERLEVRVERCRPLEYYGGLEFTGRLVADSRLVPWLVEGEPLRFTEQDVVDWTSARDGNTHSARDEAERWWEETRHREPVSPAAADGNLQQETATDNADPSRD